MTQASQPDTDSSTPDCNPVPAAIRKLAQEWVYDADLPAEWENAIAWEFDAAIADRKLELVRTHKEGRPYDVPLVEWEAWDLDKTQDVAEMLAEMGQARREMGAEVAACPLCGKPSDDGSVHQDCADYEAMYADRIPAEDAPEAAASQESWR